MVPLLLFHLRVGVRVAIRASPPLFCGILAAIMFQDPPGAATASLAKAAFASRWTPGIVVPIAAIAFSLSAWGRQRILEGQTGWIRHLPVSRTSHRLGMLLALLSVQLPLGVMLGLFGLIAKRLGMTIALPALRWALVFIAAATVNLLLPHRHRSASWRTSGALLNWQLTWRAVGLRLIPALVAGVACIAASWLFIVNNQLSGSNEAAAARFGGAMGSVFCLASLAKQIAIRRPVWPLARSFPWSAARRIADDSLFAAVCILPLLLMISVRNPGSALMVLTVLPLLSVRAAEYMRRVPERRVATMPFVGEGLVIAVALTLLPWTAAIWAAATIPALYSAQEFEKNRKATVWLELNHVTAGDSSSWSA